MSVAEKYLCYQYLNHVHSGIGIIADGSLGSTACLAADKNALHSRCSSCRQYKRWMTSTQHCTESSCALYLLQRVSAAAPPPPYLLSPGDITSGLSPSMELARLQLYRQVGGARFALYMYSDREYEVGRGMASGNSFLYSCIRRYELIVATSTKS